MKEIILTQNMVALVNDEDFEWLNQWKWYANKNRNTFYAIRNIRINKKRKAIRMHREILGLTFGDDKISDHINHNGLDNQRHNLRIATHNQNGMNQKVQIGKTSKYKGVFWNKNSNKWQAQIRINGRSQYLGLFNNEISAAQAYDNKARELFNKYANLNFNK